MTNLKESCMLAYKSDKNTSEVLASYREKGLVEAKDIMSAFVADCIKINAWRTKRQLGNGNSENPSGWKAVKSAALAILEREPTNKAAMVLCGAAVLYNRLSTMIASQKADAKKADAKKADVNTADAVGLLECPVTTVWDIDPPAMVVYFPLMERSASVAEAKLAAILAVLAPIREKGNTKQLGATIQELLALTA